MLALLHALWQPVSLTACYPVHTLMRGSSSGPSSSLQGPASMEHPWRLLLLKAREGDTSMAAKNGTGGAGCDKCQSVRAMPLWIALGDSLASRHGRVTRSMAAKNGRGEST
eukprot:1158860-Pelagomonas_calceolata.AAC.7